MNLIAATCLQLLYVRISLAVCGEHESGAVVAVVFCRPNRLHDSLSFTSLLLLEIQVDFSISV